jgi:putative transposase
MTRGLHRYQQAGNFHFITFSCYRRRRYLNSAASRRLFESALERIRKRYGFVVLGYVVMPEHVHLLINDEKNSTLDRAVQALKLSVTRRRKERPFWQPRYYDFNVWNPEKTTEKLKCMHRNPVKRGNQLPKTQVSEARPGAPGSFFGSQSVETRRRGSVPHSTRL